TMLCAQTLSAAPESYPTPPSGVTLTTLTGILMDYFMGNQYGYIQIKKADGTLVRINASYPMYVGGQQTNCAYPRFPTPGPNNSNSPTCANWPSSVKLKTTNVDVRVWQTTFNGVQYFNTNTITVH